MRDDKPGWLTADGFAIELRAGEDGWIVAECPAIRGCVSQGKTPQEALENIGDAIVACTTVMAEMAAVGGLKEG